MNDEWTLQIGPSQNTFFKRWLLSSTVQASNESECYLGELYINQLISGLCYNKVTEILATNWRV